MKKLIILLSVILIVTSAAIAQENMGARPIGMGGAFTALADDANAIFLNPAGIGFVRGEVASISSKLSPGNEYTVIGGVEGTSFGSYGIGYISSSYPVGSLVSSSSDDQGDTSVRAINQTLILSYARQLNDFMVVPEFMGKLSFGSNLKFVNSRLNNAKGLKNDWNTGINMDVAANFKPNNTLTCGISLKNLLGADSWEYGDSSASGPSFAAGISGKLFDDSLILSLENGSAGCELRLIPGLALRFGKDGDYNTAGIGISLYGFGIDYAYMDKEDPIHYLAVSIAIDRSKSENDSRQASLGLE